MNELQLMQKAGYYLDMFKRGKRFFNLSKKDQKEFDEFMKELKEIAFDY